MTDYKLYPNLPPLVPPEALGPRSAENNQVAYHLSVIQAKMQGLKNKEQMFKKKYEKYTKILVVMYYTPGHFFKKVPLGV